MVLLSDSLGSPVWNWGYSGTFINRSWQDEAVPFDFGVFCG